MGKSKPVCIHLWMLFLRKRYSSAACKGNHRVSFMVCSFLSKHVGTCWSEVIARYFHFSSSFCLSLTLSLFAIYSTWLPDVLVFNHTFVLGCFIVSRRTWRAVNNMSNSFNCVLSGLSSGIYWSLTEVTYRNCPFQVDCFGWVYYYPNLCFTRSQWVSPKISIWYF